MREVFVISNQQGLFLGKQGQWLDESEPTAVWRSPHRDVALNHMIESNARDIEQRLVLLQCPLNEKDIPLLGDAELARRTAPVTFDEPEAVQVDEEEILTEDVSVEIMSSEENIG
ncbi:MAG TPA: hypothetical protein PKZ68_02740 [Pseudomonadales bacterium]|jgi:hypothetical protein|nr:hypothetical protein [Pseudomonadales bacterium]HNI37190.1 hypothetical protein [Pseudomonadales bacterium]HNL91433.1 hypothetical protein [Pseudomonadales bacterium]HNN87426.1 hypothetical protein [Pseudomonadales bacterium]